MKGQACSLGASALTLPSCGMAEPQTPPAKENNKTIETVVVTAERRSGNLMTTAISAGVLIVRGVPVEGRT